MRSNRQGGKSWQRWTPLVVLLLTSFLLAGCGLFGGTTEAPTPPPTRTPVPTFTATVAPSTPAPTPTPALPVAADLLPTPPAAVVAAAPAVTPAVATQPTPAPPQSAAAELTVAGDLTNIRSGPGTDYAAIGTANTGDVFAAVARSAQGDWWEICCVDGQNGWVFGELATVTGAENLPAALDLPAAPAANVVILDAAPAAAAPVAAQPPPAEAAATPTTAAAAAPASAPDPNTSSAGFFDPNAQYKIVHFKVLGLDENNGGIRDSSAQHLIMVTVLDQNGAAVDGAVIKNLVGEKGEVVTGSKGPGTAEITMYWEPFKLTVAANPSGPVTSQVSNQMGLAFPHLPDLVGKLGDVNYEYGACPTLEIRCQWPIQAIHFSYEITFQKQ